MIEREYCVWTANYYDSPFRIFPGPDDVIGRFRVRTVAELRERLKQAGHTIKDVRWELVSP